MRLMGNFDGNEIFATHRHRRRRCRCNIMIGRSRGCPRPARLLVTVVVDTRACARPQHTLLLTRKDEKKIHNNNNNVMHIYVRRTHECCSRTV